MACNYGGRSRFICPAATLLILFVLYPIGLWAAAGNKRWMFPAEATVGSITSSPAIGQDGTIYVGSEDGNVYAIRPDGTKKWQLATGGKVTSSPVVHYYSGIITIYVGSEDGKLYAIDSEGTKKWEFAASGGISSSPAISYLGTIYVGSEDGKVYAINSSSGTSEGGE
jgi:outer membrane protein assembly factor BamB